MATDTDAELSNDEFFDALPGHDVHPQPVRPMQLTSMDEFDKELEALIEAGRARHAKPILHHLPKKPKQLIAPEDLVAEHAAKDEISSFNWVGQLIEYRNTHPPVNGVVYTPVITFSGRFAFNVVITESTETFGGTAVSFASKKVAKQYAAKKAIDWLTANNYIHPKGSLKTVDAETLAAEQLARDEIGNFNWTGQLLEYRNAHPGILTYTAITLQFNVVRFAFYVSITESQDKFGGEDVSFSNKAMAKQYASKKAIDWLIKNKHMPADGTVKFPKPETPTLVSQSSKRKSISASDPGTPTNAPPASASYASQVPALCHKLGLTIPVYIITRNKGDENAFYNGYAQFSDPRIEGKVGKVCNVFGQKKAKEQIAEIVCSFLRDIERQRSKVLEVDNWKRQRMSDNLGNQADSEEKRTEMEVLLDGVFS